MIREPLRSSSLKSAGYDEGRMTLEIEFLKTGDVYRYLNVPVEIYTDFLNAESQGRFYVKYIRDAFEVQVMKRHI
jgi:hypothetical protein